MKVNVGEKLCWQGCTTKHLDLLALKTTENSIANSSHKANIFRMAEADGASRTTSSA